MKPQTNYILYLEVVAQGRNLPSWKQFSHNQLLMIQQLQSSNLSHAVEISLCKVTLGEGDKFHRTIKSA